MKAFLVFSFLVFLHYSGGCIKKGPVLNLGNIQIDIDSVVGKMNLHSVQSIDKVYLYLILILAPLKAWLVVDLLFNFS